jgi:PleD family two-component response regulator
MPATSILICARGQELRSELESALTDAGHRVESVSTPADAVASMRARPVDLIVAEGLAASGAIASLRTSSDGRITPIVVVAPARDVEARIAFLEAGADDVIEVELQATSTTLRAEVTDPGAGFAPAGRQGEMDDPGGWGLVLVERIAASWGVERADRTRVWFELAAA